MSKISHPLYPDIPSSIPCAIGQFDSGTYNSAFPDSCVLKGSMATVPGEDSKAVKADFVRFITERVSAQNPWFRTIRPRSSSPATLPSPPRFPLRAPLCRS